MRLRTREWARNDERTAVAEHPTVLEFDVAEDMNRCVYDQDVVYEDGMPAGGRSFITRGYLYPTGTLTGSNGVNPDGSPEFPDLVIGDLNSSPTTLNGFSHKKRRYCTHMTGLGRTGSSQPIMCI